ncbi:MAG: hypothetical protein CTY25_01490 [Methylobacterium sp.]|nr:MAG: hypothetical protein CTY25_01490 [Methylobacterium sp.]
MRTKVLMALLAGVPVLATSNAMAQQARPVPKNASEAIVVNGRNVAVTGLEITSAKGDKVGTLQKALEPGKRMTFRFRPRNGCVFTIAAAFADEVEFEPTEQDLCVDKVIRFVD